MERIIAVGGVIKKDGKYLLIQEAAEEIRGKWNIPAGRLDPGETSYDGAKREIREECGLDVNLTGVAQVVDIALPTGELVLCIAFSTEIIGGEIAFDPEEILDVEWFTYGEILQMHDELREYDWVTNAISAVENNHIGHLKMV